MMAQVVPLLLIAGTHASGRLVAKGKGSKAPPHIVLLYADDLGFSDLGVVGASGHKSSSPTIDALAKEGVVFNCSYVYVWCAPSRAALM
eukprot:COSAG01_NODE_4307_length_5145_cov_9.287299_5_plen_89_part_00